MHLILVRHGDADHNRGHSYGFQQEFDPNLTATAIETTEGESVQPSGIEQAIACGDALVQHLFDGPAPTKQQQAAFGWALLDAERKRGGARATKPHPLPFPVAPREVQMLTSLLPRARQTAGHIAEQMRLAGFPLPADHMAESAALIELDMPYKRLNQEGREALLRTAARHPDSPEAKRIRILSDEKRAPAIIPGRYPYAPKFTDIQTEIRTDLQRFLDHCERTEAKVGIIVAHAVTLQAIRGLLCGIPAAKLEPIRLQGTGSALAVDLPEGIGSGRVLGYIHGQPYQRNDYRNL